MLLERQIVEAISIETIRKIVGEANISYQHTKTWKASTDPAFSEKKRIEALYQCPPEDGRILCVDEFGPLSIQPQKGKGWFPEGHPRRLPATYRRTHGVKHLLAALDLKTDTLYRHQKATKNHRDFLGFLNVLRRRFHRSERLYITLDNFSPHNHRKVLAWAAQNNVELIYAPIYASWLNRIECHFGPLRKFVLEPSHYQTHGEMGKAIQTYLRWRNKHKRHEASLREQKKIKVA